MKMITLVANHIGVDTYLWLREAVGFKKLTRTQAVKALKNSLYVVAAYADDRIVGMGGSWGTERSSVISRIS